MSDTRETVREATNQVRKLREIATDLARSIEADAIDEDVDRLRRAADGYGETPFEESDENMAGKDKKQDKEMELEDLAAMFPSLTEMPEDEKTKSEIGSADSDEVGMPGPRGFTIDVDDETPDGRLPARRNVGGDKYDEAAEIPVLGEDDMEGDVDDIEIDEAELRKVYEDVRKATIQAEAQVSKGFKDMTDAGEEIDPAGGLADVKKGENAWEKVEPPAKKDWTVAEAVAEVGRLRAVGKNLREKLSRAHGMLKTVVEKMHSINVFNSKVMHANRIFSTNPTLTREQRATVLESLDRAASVDEVRKIYGALGAVLGGARKLAEAKASKGRPKFNAQRAQRRSAGDGEVLREQAGEASGGNAQYTRWQELAQLR